MELLIREMKRRLNRILPQGVGRETRPAARGREEGGEGGRPDLSGKRRTLTHTLHRRSQGKQAAILNLCGNILYFLQFHSLYFFLILSNTPTIFSPMGSYITSPIQADNGRPGPQ